MEFAQSENATPRKSGKATRETFDFILDGDYLVGSFMQHTESTWRPSKACTGTCS